MRKFGEIYKEQLKKSESLHEGKVLNDFRKVYDALLEKYSTSEFHQLSEEHQTVFLTELSNYWKEESGISEKGEKFLHKNVDMLNEDSTTLQKRNVLKKRSVAAINETIRQSELKWRLYSVIDDVYKEVKASKIQEVLSPDVLVKTIHDSMATSLKELMKEINYELTESSKSQKKTLNENFEVFYSDGMRAAKKFTNYRKALSFMEDKIKNNPQMQEVALYRDEQGFHSTTQDEYLIAWWGEGSYWDNRSKREPELLDKWYPHLY